MARAVSQVSRSTRTRLTILRRLLLLGAVLVVAAIVLAQFTSLEKLAAGIFASTAVLGLIMVGGYFTLQPNQARVLILFGAYKGTVRSSGFHWANPFFARSRGMTARGGDAKGAGARRHAAGGLRLPLTTKLSLRAHNFSSEALKVNDKRGNPVEIAAVVVWRVENTAQAIFDVEDYTSYVEIQSESAIRSIASRYAYDQGEEHEITLRGGAAAYAGRVHDARSDLDEAVAVAQRCGSMRMGEWPVTLRAFLEVSCGNYQAALDAVAPLLMFVGDAEEAMRFYVSVFFPARIERLERILEQELDTLAEWFPLLARQTAQIGAIEPDRAGVGRYQIDNRTSERRFT